MDDIRAFIIYNDLSIDNFQPSDCRLGLPTVAIPFGEVMYSANVHNDQLYNFQPIDRRLATLPSTDGAYRMCIHNGLLVKCCDDSIVIFDKELNVCNTIYLDEDICLTNISSHRDVICASSLNTVRVYKNHKLVCTLRDE